MPKFSPHLGLRSLLILSGIALVFSACSKDGKKKAAKEVPNEQDIQDEANLKKVDPNPQPAALEEVIAEPDEEVPETVIDETAIVSVIGYHDFTEKRRPTEMLINVDKFRKQMQMLKDADIAVVSLEDYLAWKRGEVNLPRRSVVITADDGWREVHRYMMPIMKEYGYPYTIFFYTDFLDGGGRTMTQQQVEEIIASGGTIGSHSISHRNMNLVKFRNQSLTFGRFERMRTAYNKGLEELDEGASAVMVEGVRRSRQTVEGTLRDLAAALEAYDTWIMKELKESKEVLEEKFKVPVKTFAYPYGPYNDRIIKMAEDVGYEALITVNGAKANFQTPVGEIPRYIIHGADDRNWNAATSFGGSGGLDSEGDLLKPKKTEDGEPQERLVNVIPDDGETIANRQPLIVFDYAKLDGVEASSLSMTVGGFGKVAAIHDKEAKTLRWQVPRKLRNRSCNVQVGLRQGGKQRRVAWEFSIEKRALYTPEYAEQNPAPRVPDIPKAVPVEE